MVAQERPDKMVRDAIVSVQSYYDWWNEKQPKVEHHICQTTSEVEPQEIKAQALNTASAEVAIYL